jgi:four helix bundle protein
MEVIMPIRALTAAAAPTLVVDRLDVYPAALDFAALASRVRVTPASLRDQMERASASIVLSLAEGVGRTSRPDQAHFFAIARGSALECAAVLDLLRARGVLRTPSRRPRSSAARRPDAQPAHRSEALCRLWSSRVSICTIRTSQERP